jgi:hypothetical protein
MASSSASIPRSIVCAASCTSGARAFSRCARSRTATRASPAARARS